MRRARYFPVSTTPLAMRAGLHPFGTDFGNGDLDGVYFQRDDAFDRYVAAKRAVNAARHAIVDDNDVRRAVLGRALAFISETLQREHGVVLDVDAVKGEGPAAVWDRVAQSLQEDFAVLHRGDNDAGDAVLLNVCFPSGWRPERLRGASFQGIHTPVPSFVQKPAAAQSMVRSMVDRGPYVRFVWTCSADDVLDHHPEEGQRTSWDGAARGWLRVERQITVPFTDVGGALFLIRTHLFPFESLTAEEKQTLSSALSSMSDEIAGYKSLLSGRARMLELLR